MTDRELLKEARDLIVMCSLLDKSNQCNEMANEIDKQLATSHVNGRFYSNKEIATLKEECYQDGFEDGQMD